MCPERGSWFLGGNVFAADTSGFQTLRGSLSVARSARARIGTSQDNCIRRRSQGDRMSTPYAPLTSPYVVVDHRSPRLRCERGLHAGLRRGPFPNYRPRNPPTKLLFDVAARGDERLVGGRHSCPLMLDPR